MSSSERKTIKFNNLVVSNKTRKNSGVKKDKPVGIIKPNVLKKTLLEKIKRHQQSEQIKEKRPLENDSDLDFQDNFMESLEYLNKLNDKHKQQKVTKGVRRNKTVKNPINRPIGSHNVSSEHIISIELPDDFDKPALKLSSLDVFTGGSTPVNTLHNPMTPSMPLQSARLPLISMNQPNNMINVNTRTVDSLALNATDSKSEPFISNVNTMVPSNIQVPVSTESPYGCLKGGSKPTYRQYYNHTLKNTTSKPSNPSTGRQHQHQTTKMKATHNKIKLVKKKTRRTTFKLGRVDGKVSVLIKNNATRRKIKREHGILKQKPMNEIKKFLYDKNLIRIGSTAPNDVIRTLYEQTVLAGDITNVGAGVTLHNFVNK